MRKFEWERKPSKKQPTSKENATIIRALNNFGRVPEQHELLNEIENLQQQLQRKDNEINDLKSSIVDYQEAVGDYQDELKRKDNIINKIKKALKDHKEIKNKTNTKEYYIEVDEVLDYIKELESK